MTKPSPFDRPDSLVYIERQRLGSRDLCHNLLYPAPQILQWVKPAGSRVAFLLNMEDEPQS
jgi:hypothetical protein